MRKNEKYLELDVPGLSEKRPSILKGDYVLVEDVINLINFIQSAKPNILFKGYCHFVLESSIKLMFSADFH